MVCNTKKRHRHTDDAFFRYIAKDLLLSALLAYEVGATEDGEDSDARAEGGVSVASATVTRHSGGYGTITAVAIDAFLLRRVAALEETAAISEGGHAQSEDDGEG